MMVRLRMIAVAVAAALVVTACGSGGDDTGTDAGSRSSAVPTSTTESTADGTAPAPAPEPSDVPRTGSSADRSPDASPPEEEIAGEDDGATADPAGDAAVYVPPAGEYVYDARGHTETSGLTNGREPVPPTSTDRVDVSKGPNATRLTVVTRDEGSDSSQEAVVDVTDTEARLVRLGYRPDSGAAYSVSPDPPALVARLPYRSGDSWEIAWSDSAIGISAVGTGTVTGRETITTPAGTFDVVVITVEQRLRGTIEGTLTVTSWIDPTTGIQAKQHLISEFRDATGSSRSDTTRTLRRHPG